MAGSTCIAGKSLPRSPGLVRRRKLGHRFAGEGIWGRDCSRATASSTTPPANLPKPGARRNLTYLFSGIFGAWTPAGFSTHFPDPVCGFGGERLTAGAGGGKIRPTVGRRTMRFATTARMAGLRPLTPPSGGVGVVNGYRRTFIFQRWNLVPLPIGGERGRLLNFVAGCRRCWKPDCEGAVDGGKHCVQFELAFRVML